MAASTTIPIDEDFLKRLAQRPPYSFRREELTAARAGAILFHFQHALPSSHSDADRYDSALQAVQLMDKHLVPGLNPVPFLRQAIGRDFDHRNLGFRLVMFMFPQVSLRHLVDAGLELTSAVLRQLVHMRTTSPYKVVKSPEDVALLRGQRFSLSGEDAEFFLDVLDVPGELSLDLYRGLSFKGAFTELRLFNFFIAHGYEGCPITRRLRRLEAVGSAVLMQLARGDVVLCALLALAGIVDPTQEAVLQPGWVPSDAERETHHASASVTLRFSDLDEDALRRLPQMSEGGAAIFVQNLSSPQAHAAFRMPNELLPGEGVFAENAALRLRLWPQQPYPLGRCARQFYLHVSGAQIAASPSLFRVGAGVEMDEGSRNKHEVARRILADRRRGVKRLLGQPLPFELADMCADFDAVDPDAVEESRPHGSPWVGRRNRRRRLD